MHGLDLIRDLAILLALAGCAGWICQRLGLSVIVGYLIAGVAMGSRIIEAGGDAGAERIQELAQVGLVFLMFSIGLSLNLAKLKKLGPALICAGLMIAMGLYNGAKLLGSSVGMDPSQSLFLAGMVMVSSSAVIGKILQEIDAAHEISGQVAMGLTIVEDLVAVAMLTFLGSIALVDSPHSATQESTFKVVASLIGFMVLVTSLALVLVPRFLSKLEKSETSPDVQTILMVALLFGIAFLAVSMGHSAALGAMLMGAVVATTRFKTQIARAFEGLHDLFAAIFFISVGMLLDIGMLIQIWPTALILSALALFLRPFAIAIALLVVGKRTADSVRASLLSIPLGEFTLIIAQLGVVSSILDSSYYAVAVTMVLITSTAAPPLMKYSLDIGLWFERHQPRWLERVLGLYQGLLQQIALKGSSNLVWRLTAPRLMQAGFQIVLISSILIFSKVIYTKIESWGGNGFFFVRDLDWIIGVSMAAALLIPFVSLWRNLSVLSLIYAEVILPWRHRHGRLQSIFETMFKLVFLCMLSAWLFTLLPITQTTLWAMGIGATALMLFALVLWRRVIRWHSGLEYEIAEVLREAGAEKKKRWVSPMRWTRNCEDWGLDLKEVFLPDQAEAAGKTLAELNLRQSFGSSLISMERQGHVITQPSADMVLYPRDHLLLLGKERDNEAAEDFLMKTRDQALPPYDPFSDLVMEMVEVIQGTTVVGKSMGELDLSHKYGVQVVGIERNGTRLTHILPQERLLAGDQVLALGTLDQIRAVQHAWSEMVAA